MTRTIKAHFESGKIVFDEKLPFVSDGTPVAVVIDFPDSGAAPDSPVAPSPWGRAALDSTFRDEENWGDTLDGFVAEDRA